MPDKESPTRKAVRTYAQASEYLGLGFQFAATILVFLFVGHWLDARFGTHPVLLVVGVFGGGAAGFITLYRDLVHRTGRRGRQGIRGCGRGSESEPPSPS
ncbi:MAG: AtpZ/AtpI family protein [Candidatus Latescibacterota bacterium]|jgi:F0F1-type ATP synthase assembly protein I